MCLQDTVRIPLRARDGSIRDYAIVDAADAEWVNRWRWCLFDGYATRSVTTRSIKRTIYLHRELLSLTPGDGFTGDHIDRNRLNCRRQNLRVLPKGGNSQNVRPVQGATSEYRGVSWDKRRRKWVAKIQANGNQRHLGNFTDEKEAAEVARLARIHHLPYATD